MRILILTALFVSGFSYFSSSKKEEVTDVVPTAPVDSIELKSAAPDRAERILTVGSAPEANPEEKIEADTSTSKVETEISTPDAETTEEVEEVAWTDLDAAWNTELKDILSRLEPAESDVIHKNYMSEVESYKAEMEALLNEKQQKTSNEAASEVDQLISQLDQKHEDRLKEIFGANYEAIRDHYNEYMQSGSESEE